MSRVAGLSAVVPAYNSELSLRPLLARLEPVLAASAERYEVILVNDGSRDDTWKVIEDLMRAHSWVRGIDLMRNCGQHNALLCGIRAAQYGLVVTLDDDLQDPPEEIPKLLAAMTGDVDVVYGAPINEVHGFWRDLASQVTKIVLQGVLGAETARMVGPFRLFRTAVRKAFDDYRGVFVNIDVLLTWGTTRFRAIRVRHDPRQLGQSNYGVGKLLTHTLNMLTGFRSSAAAAGQLPRLRVDDVRRGAACLRLCALRDPGCGRSWLCVPGVDHHHLFGNTALLAGRDRRVPLAHAFPPARSSGIRHPGAR